MKLALKILLTLVALLAGVYAAAPLWLPRVLAGQLPPGWQLVELKSGYPRPTGIDAELITLKGTLGSTELSLTGSDLSVLFSGLETDVGKLSVDVFLHTGVGEAGHPVTLDDLPIPIQQLTGRFPRLSARRIDVTVHLPDDVLTGILPPAMPVMLDLEDVLLTPSKDDGIQLSARLGFEDSLRLTGKLEVSTGSGTTRAALRFPSGEAVPWLELRFDQVTSTAMTTTRIEAALNTDAANREWLDSVIARSTRRAITQIDGKLDLSAEFSGRDQQGIDLLEFNGANLQLLSDRAMLKIDTDLVAKRHDDSIAVDLQKPVTFEYQGDTGWIDELTAMAIPGLRLQSRSGAKLTSRITSDSGISIAAGHASSASAIADFDIDLESTSEHLTLKSTGLQIAVEDLYTPESATLEGVVMLDWKLDAPVAYSADGLELTADGLGVSAEVASRGGKLTSTGKGVVTKAGAASPLTSAEILDLKWRNLDLETLTGRLAARTEGFSTVHDGQTWKGFDLDMNLSLLVKNGIGGTGRLVFGNGSELPIEFSGNTQTMRWDIHLAPVTIKLAKLRSLLAVAGIELPSSIKMTDGDLDLQGDVKVGDDITARLLLGGHDLIASLHNSRVLGGGFSFNAGYDKTPQASGPVSIETLALAGDIELRNIKAELQLEDVDRFELKNLYAETFDGRLELDSLRYSEDGIADTTVRLSHIDLGKLLAYADVDGLQGSGILDITLPIGSDKTGMHVKNGTFASSGSGRLAYTREGMAATNIGMQALENFHYKSLSGTLDYQSDGAYLMSVRLEGSNPDLYGGHPVVFNLNINGTLPELFEAMFMTGSFEESILNQIKTR